MTKFTAKCEQFSYNLYIEINVMLYKPYHITWYPRVHEGVKPSSKIAYNVRSLGPLSETTSQTLYVQEIGRKKIGE